MKLTITHFSIPSSHELDSMVEERLLALSSRLHIEEATVALARHHQTSPAFRARIHVVTPGPDLTVEAADHTILAAIAQGLAELHRKLDSRDRQRIWRDRRHRLKSSRPRPGTVR